MLHTPLSKASKTSNRISHKWSITMATISKALWKSTKQQNCDITAETHVELYLMPNKSVSFMKNYKSLMYFARFSAKITTA